MGNRSQNCLVLAPGVPRPHVQGWLDTSVVIEEKDGATLILWETYIRPMWARSAMGLHACADLELELAVQKALEEVPLDKHRMVRVGDELDFRGSYVDHPFALDPRVLRMELALTGAKSVHQNALSNHTSIKKEVDMLKVAQSVFRKQFLEVSMEERFGGINDWSFGGGQYLIRTDGAGGFEAFHSGEIERSGHLSEIITDGALGAALTINTPDLFKDAEFIAWLNSDECRATWHKKGQTPNEYSDVFVVVDPSLSGEGCSQDSMPEHAWQTIVDAVASHFLPHQCSGHITVRITNLEG